MSFLILTRIILQLNVSTRLWHSLKIPILLLNMYSNPRVKLNEEYMPDDAPEAAAESLGAESEAAVQASPSTPATSATPPAKGSVPTSVK